MTAAIQLGQRVRVVLPPGYEPVAGKVVKLREHTAFIEVWRREEVVRLEFALELLRPTEE